MLTRVTCHIGVNQVLQGHQGFWFVNFPEPSLVVHAVYHKERCDISVDKIFPFKIFFLGFFSVCLPNIYFNILEYLSTLDLLSFNQSDL